MNNKFICPNCKKKQKIKNLFFMSNNSSWRCHKCNVMLKPEKMSSISNQIGFLSVVIPAYISIFLFKFKLLNALLIGLLIGVISYFIVTMYYYIKIELEEM